MNSLSLFFTFFSPYYLIAAIALSIIAVVTDKPIKTLQSIIWPDTDDSKKIPPRRRIIYGLVCFALIVLCEYFGLLATGLFTGKKAQNTDQTIATDSTIDSTAEYGVSTEAIVAFDGIEYNTYHAGANTSYFSPSKEYHVGDYFFLGRTEQDNNLSNGAEFIEWRVLSVEDGQILAITKYGLEYRAYSLTQASWDYSDLRNYLNSSLYLIVFDDYDRNYIVDVNDDYMFCLSVDEVYRFFSTTDWSDRICQATKYAKEQKGSLPDNSDTNAWWLRTTGTSDKFAGAAVVRGNRPTKGAEGAVNEYGYSIIGDNVLVRPAIYVRIG